MFRSKFAGLAVIFLILIATDLSEAKSKWKYKPPKRTTGGVSYYGGGAFDWEIFLYVIGGIAGFVILICCCCSQHCEDANDEEDKVVGQKIQEDNQQTNINNARYQQNHQNSNHGSELSPNHFSYPISPANVPQSGQNPTNYVTETVSHSLHAAPNYASETRHQPLPTTYVKTEISSPKTNNGIQNETVLSLPNLPNSLTPTYKVIV